MEKNLMTYAARRLVLAFFFCCAITASAQEGRYAQGGYSAPSMPGYSSTNFQKLPPLKADFDISLSPHSQLSLLQTSLQNPQQMDNTDNQSIMFRHKEKNESTQFHYKRPRYMMTGGDGLKGIRDRIVRDRREKEGRPLQPLPPGMHRR